MAAQALQMRTVRLKEANERAAKVGEQHSSVGQSNDWEVLLMLARPLTCLG